MINKKDQLRAYIRAIPGLTLSRQQEMASDAGCAVVYTYGEAGRRQDVRSAWARSMRPGDVAWVPALQCLVTPHRDRQPRERPVSDLAAVVADVLARGAVIVEGRSGMSSRDGERWTAHIKAALGRASQGERSRASRLRAWKKSAAHAEPGVVARWLAPAKTRDREAARATWCSVLYKSDADAASALPPELSGLSGSTLRRILGPRRPGDKRAGGRPRIVKVKTR